jgi:cytidylate kinase
MSNIINIAIDGPSGAGKSSLAKKVAKSLGFIYVDTGAMYRTIALYVIRSGIATSDSDKVIAALPKIDLSISYIDGEQRVILNGEDVSGLIRTGEISMGASAVSAIPEVREFLLETQRKLARENSVVMDGRDIATVILPNADVKIFLTADDRRRAERRYAELKVKDPTLPLESVYEDMVNRDKNDSTRKVAPAIRAKDATLLDNTDFTEEETLAAALSIIKEKTGIK